MTQLPAAAQLSGETRTQVQQLITNFNELITNTTDWRASYDKVAETLSSLLGPDTADTAAASASPTAAATPDPGATTAGAANAGAANAGAANAGAVGTSGTATAQLDPALRAKLVELRTHLKQFEKASGGGGK